MKIPFTACLCALLYAAAAGCLHAQNASEGSSHPPVILKASLLPWLSPFKMAADLNADVQLLGSFYGDVGAGYFLGSNAFARYQGERYTGPRLRAGIKWLFPIRTVGFFHVGLLMKYHDALNTQYKTTFRQGGQYSEILPVERRIRSRSTLFRVGSMYFLGARKRWVIETNLGIGPAVHHVDLRNLPPDAQLLFNRFLSFELPQGIHRRPDIMLALQLGYCF